MKVRVDNYSFDASARTITFTDYTTIRLDAVLLITNVTDNIIVYNFADVTKGGTVLTNVLTLTYSTTAMDDADKLLIYYDDPSKSTDTTDLATSVNQVTLNSLIGTLQELIQRLAPLAGAIASTQALRVTPISTTVVSGSVTASGGGYITSAQSITEKALAGVSYTQRTAAENLTAIQSNIQNITAK